MKGKRTGIHLAAEDHAHTTHARLDDGAVLGAVIDDFVLPVFDFGAGAWVPWFSEDGDGFEFVA